MSERHVNGDEEQPSTITEVDALPGAIADTASFQRPNSEIDPPDVSMDNPFACRFAHSNLCQHSFDGASV